MGSENKMNDGMSFQQSDKPSLCVNGCGFFGTAATMNLCSKCHRDLHLKEEQAAVVKKSMTSISPPPPVTIVVEEKKDLPAVELTAMLPENPENRCGSCNKKVGVIGFKCRCGTTFCGSHRYPEEHDCTFDFKGAGRDAIAKANPVVKADKLERL